MTKKASKKKVSKKASEANPFPETVPEAAAPSNAALLDRIEALEAKQKILVKGLKFAGDTVKPVFGQALIGAVFHELYSKLK